MFFGVFNFFQKTNENKSNWGIVIVKSNSLVRFLEESSAWKNDYDFVWPLILIGFLNEKFAKGVATFNPHDFSLQIVGRGEGRQASSKGLDMFESLVHGWLLYFLWSKCISYLICNRSNSSSSYHYKAKEIWPQNKSKCHKLLRSKSKKKCQSVKNPCLLMNWVLYTCVMKVTLFKEIS